MELGPQKTHKKAHLRRQMCILGAIPPNSIKGHPSSAKCNRLVFNALENVMSMLYCLKIVEESMLFMSNHYLPP